MIKVAIAGATGRMGQLIANQIVNDSRFQLNAITKSPSNNSDIIIHGLTASSNPVSLFEKADVVIDFTKPQATRHHLLACQNNPKPMVIGTTGLSDSDKESLQQTAKVIPILYASNTSFGVTLMKSMVKKMAKILDSSFDIEIFEAHHRHKADAPSGTSLSLAKAAADGRGISFNDAICLNHQHLNNKARSKDEIGISVMRGGGIIGDHSVHFMGEEEELIISHRAFSRNLFVKGALFAAAWLVHQQPGLYSMDDVLLSKISHE